MGENSDAGGSMTSSTSDPRVRHPQSAGRPHLDTSAAGDECDYDIRGMAIEVLASVVVDGGGKRIRMTRGDLNVAQRERQRQVPP
jgi:hypothetical protein